RSFSTGRSWAEITVLMQSRVSRLTSHVSRMRETTPRSVCSWAGAACRQPPIKRRPRQPCTPLPEAQPVVSIHTSHLGDLLSHCDLTEQAAPPLTPVIWAISTAPGHPLTALCLGVAGFRIDGSLFRPAGDSSSSPTPPTHLTTSL